jgi:hypothetical protein
MPDSPRPPISVPKLDRASLERVLARAAELQGAAGDADPSEQFTEEQLIELGKEVGLSPQNLRQALAEERTRSVLPEDEHGLGTSVFGPSRICAGRTVPGKPSDVLAAINAWMQKQETLIVKRQHADRIVWEPSRDIGVVIKRAFKPGGRDFALANSHEVSATVIAIDDARVHVVLDGSFENLRGRAIGQTAGGGLIGIAVGTGIWAIGLAAAVVAAPVVVATVGGFVIARASQRKSITRAQLALEQLLDTLERGELTRRPETLLGAIVAAATQQLPPRRF